MVIGDDDHDHNADNGEGDKSGQTREGEQGVVHLKTVMMKMMKAILIYPTYILYPVMMKEFLLADRKYPYNGADQANKKKMVHRNVFITNIPAFFCSVKNGENI